MFANNLKKAVFLNQKRFFHNPYIIHPLTRSLEQQMQASYLTKTVIAKHHLLPRPPRNDVTTQEKETMINNIKRCVLDVIYFQRDEELKLPKKWSPKRREDNINQWRSEFRQQILLNMMRVVWTTPSARLIGRHSLSHKTQVAAPWTHLDVDMEVRGALGYLINGKKTLPLFASRNKVAATVEHPISWDDIISPFFDLHKEQSRFEANSGFHANSSFPCPQTLILLHNTAWSTHAKTGQAIYFSFAHALNYALAQGEKMGEDLKNPVAVQCIVFNGIAFDFICYQLNTLDFSSNDGVKNMAWIRDELKLYSNVTDKPSNSVKDRHVFPCARVSLVDYDRKRLSETFHDTKDVTVTIEGFRPGTAGTFVDFLFRPYSSYSSVINSDDVDDDVVGEEVASA